MIRPPRRQPRAGRVQFDAIDEVVIGDWLHAEHMGSDQWFVRLGDRALWLYRKRGKMVVVNDEVQS